MTVSNLAIVFAGGGLGATLRYFISLWIKASDRGFPTSTFWVNITGCFLIGLLYTMISAENQTIRLLLIVGLLGGYTTFSSFGMETMGLFKAGNYQMAFFYVILSNICGLVAVYLGVKLASAMS